MNAVCHICGVELPNRWAIGRIETVDGAPRHYCHLHANMDFGKKNEKELKNKENEAMSENKDIGPIALLYRDVAITGGD